MAHHIYSYKSQIFLKFSRGHILVCINFHWALKWFRQTLQRKSEGLYTLVLVNTSAALTELNKTLKSLICITKCKDFEKESCSRLPSQQSPAVHTFRWLHQTQPLEFGQTDHSLFLWNSINPQSYKSGVSKIFFF